MGAPDKQRPRISRSQFGPWIGSRCRSKKKTDLTSRAICVSRERSRSGFDKALSAPKEVHVAIAEARVRFWAEHPTGLPAEVALQAEARRRRVRESGQLGLLDPA